MKISVVIPACNAARFLPALLERIERQTLPPAEVIIVDSGKDAGTGAILRKWRGRVPVVHHRVDFAYPGVARNIGVTLARHEWIAFLDCRTLPCESWLATCAAAAESEGADFVGAIFESVADTRFQETLLTATYGKVGVRSLPGSLMRKDLFNLVGFFLPVRAGEDMEWLKRVANLRVRMTVVPAPVLSYHGFPDSFSGAMRKWYSYTISNARIDVLNIQKMVFSSLLVGFAVLFTYKWNELFANWNEESFWYVPNITKLFVLSLALCYALYRGVVRPLRRGVKLTFLLPLRWLEVSFICFCLDVAKAPGLLLGAYILLWKKISSPPRTAPTEPSSQEDGSGAGP